MKLNRLIILAIVFVVLASLYVVSENISRKQKTTEIPMLFEELEREVAKQITIKSPEKGVVALKKNTEGWTLFSDNETYKADLSNVNKVLDTTARIRARTVASKNPEKFEAFEVTKNTGVEVEIKDQNENLLASFYVGKSGPDIFSTYLKKTGSDEVILTEGILKTVFEKDIGEWRDKTVFDIPAKDIVKYSIEGEVSFVLQKDDDGTWHAVAPDEFTVNQQEANRAVERFAGLKSADFEKGELKEFGLGEPQKRITAFLNDGSSKTLLFGEGKNSFQSFAMVEGENQVYVVENYNLETMIPDIDTLKEQDIKETASDNSTEAVGEGMSGG